jgi:hypothetical protein
MLEIEDLKTKSVFEIKSFAKKNNIDLKDARTKIEMLNLLEGKEVITIAKQEVFNKVALYSEHNKVSEDRKMGSLKVGYNIVTKEVADWWLARKGVRLATPNELARYYGIE